MGVLRKAVRALFGGLRASARPLSGGVIGHPIKEIAARWPFTDIENAQQLLEDRFEIPRGDWVAVPDQEPGCLDDWVGPVRITRAAEEAAPEWERDVDGA